MTSTQVTQGMVFFDTVQGPDLNVARLAETLLAIGRTDEALAYATTSLAKTRRCIAPILQAVARGRVRTARGEDAAALEALEWAATDAQRCGMPLHEIRALVSISTRILG